MTRRWLVVAVALSACFAEPPASDSPGAEASSSSGVDTRSETSISASTGAAGMTTGDATTGTLTIDETTTTSGTTTTTTSDDTTGDPRAMPFCEAQMGANLLACSDFDSEVHHDAVGPV